MALAPMKTMKTRLLLALVGSTIGFVSQIFAQRTVDPKIDQQIPPDLSVSSARVFTMKYDEAFNKNNATTLGALFSEDAVLSGPHGYLHRVGKRLCGSCSRADAFRFYQVSAKSSEVTADGLTD